MTTSASAQPVSSWESYKRLLSYTRRYWKLFLLAVVGFAIEHPEIAAGIAGVLFLVGLVLLLVLARLVRRGWRRWKKKDVVPDLA